MQEHLFFDPKKLGSCGTGVIIGMTVRIRYPELVHIGDNCIIDDFTYISTGLVLAGYNHIAAGCKLIGGKKCRVKMGEFSTLAPNVVLSAGSDDYWNGVATPFVPERFKGAAQFGEIEIGRHSIVGAGSVVLPGARFREGSAVGALSLVKSDLSPWELYVGIPARPIGRRNMDSILEAERAFRHSLSHV